MRKISLAVFAIVCATGSASAQTMAKVGGVPITLEQVIAANPAAKTNKSVRSSVLFALINRQAVLNAAERLGLAKTPAFETAVDQARQNILIQEMAQRFYKDHPVTQQAIAAEYKKAFDKPFPEEYRLREITMASFKAGKSIITDIKHGKSFTILAAEQSTDKASGAVGGEVGWQMATHLLAPILKTVKTMKVEQVAGPIAVPQGFAVIQLLGERPTPKPTMDQVTPQITNAIRQHDWIEHVIKLRSQQGAHLVVPLTGN
ncbi:MAG: peptidylprolyl isomerase [Leptodesmis sp.]|uniref:peptidylprolyl isomerase n=1 Tax=Leptodesmis sp. TaxID=3100501 RepID=UPI003D0DD1F2